MRSVVVVLPASMWAMMPILRIWRRSVWSGSLAMFVCSSSRQDLSVPRGLAAEIQHLLGLPVLGLLSSLARKLILHSLPPEEPGNSASRPHAHRRAPLIPALHRPASLPVCAFRKLGIPSIDSSRVGGFTAVLRAGDQGIMAPLG